MWCRVYLSTEIKYLLLSTNQFVTEFDIEIDMSQIYVPLKDCDCLNMYD